jgi:excisionase family DNA binding protein
LETQEQLLTVRQLAELLQVAPDTVYRMARNNEIPSYRRGRSWRFDRSAVLETLASQQN